MELHIKTIGILLIILGFVHVIFPRYFNWKTELPSLSLINRQIMMVHTFFIALLLVLLGMLCLTATSDLVSTGLGKQVCLGLGFFWSCRLFIQLFGYSSELWRGKKFETFVHVLFTGFWVYLSSVFFMLGLTG